DTARAQMKREPWNAQEIITEAITGKIRELGERQKAYDRSTVDGQLAIDGLQAQIDGMDRTRSEIKAGAEKIAKLKKQGYAPLMRFGRYSVHVWSEGQNGKPATEFFGMYESEREANAAARALQKDFPDYVVDKGIMSQEAWRLFNGVSPDTLEVFARALGADESEVFQEYLRLTVNNRS